MAKQTLEITIEGRTYRMMRRAERIKQTIDVKQRELNEIRDSLKDEIEESKYDEYLLYDDNELPLSAAVHHNISIDYDTEKLKQRLDKHQLREVCDSILVVDQSSFSEFLEHHPEVRKELRKCIHKVSTVNIDKLNIAYERGVITQADLKGCYTVSKRPVLKIQRKRGV